MIDCTALDAHLADYLAGRLDDATASALERHAGECDRCAALLEARTRLDVTLPPELDPPPALRAAILAHPPRRRPARRVRWLVPPALAAMLLLGLMFTRPVTKGAQGRPVENVPGAMAASRADGEFARLATARGEVAAALRASPGDRALQDALDRLDNQRRTLENIVREYES